MYQPTGLDNQLPEYDIGQLQRPETLTSLDHHHHQQQQPPLSGRTMDEDSAYITGPNSVASVSSSADDDDDDERSDSEDSYQTSTGSVKYSAPVADKPRRDFIKKKSCPALAPFDDLADDDTYQRLALSDDESGSSGPAHSHAGNKSVFPAVNVPSYAMAPVTLSARRRFGQKRGTAAGVVKPTENAENVADQRKYDFFTQQKASGRKPESVPPRKLHRNPSSLFYLDYIDEEDVINEDVEYKYVEGSQYRSFNLAALSTSRKLSAAAYAPRVADFDIFEGEFDDEEYDDDDDDETTRTSENDESRAFTIDELEENLRQIDALTKPFRLGEEVYEQIKTLLNSEMDRGLARDTHFEAKVKMFHTHVRSLPDGTEFGRYVALDLGGTNFRVLLVNLRGSELPEINSKVFLIPLRIMLGPGVELFDHIAKCMAEFLEENGMLGEPLPLGFTFSFPCIQDELASARLARWTKGFKCSGVENEDVVRLLHEAISRRNDLNVKCVAVINDNVGVLMMGSHMDNKCRVGLILGTGTNCCYVEDLHKVEMWQGESEEPRKMVINTEWGAFGDDGSLDFMRNQYDRRLDVASLNPGHQLFEKMVSGMYMGEIVRLVLCELMLRGLIFHGRCSDDLLEPYRFYTKYISEIESDDPAGDYANTRMVLQELLKCSATREDCCYVQHVCWQVSQRAAFLVATAVAVVIRRLDLDEVTVAVDGSLYRFHPHFKDIMRTKIEQLVEPRHKFKLILADDGSGQGAALVAAISSKTKPTTQQTTGRRADDTTNDVDNKEIKKIFMID